MNYTEIIEALKNSGISISEFAYDDFDKPIKGIGECKEIAQYGGEGMGDTWYSVKYFPEHDVYIKVSGFYSSYNGTDFTDYDSDCHQVTPQQKTITVYE